MTESSGPELAYRSSPQAYAKAQLAELDDGELVAQSLGGKDLAFEVLVDRYSPMVLGYLWGKTPSATDCEDLTQEVFLTAFRYLKRLRASDRLGGWLLRIARSRLMDFHRTRSRRPRIVDTENPGETESPAAWERAPDAGPSPRQSA